MELIDWSKIALLLSALTVVGLFIGLYQVAGFRQHLRAMWVFLAVAALVLVGLYPFVSIPDYSKEALTKLEDLNRQNQDLRAAFGKMTDTVSRVIAEERKSALARPSGDESPYQTKELPVAKSPKLELAGDGSRTKDKINHTSTRMASASEITDLATDPIQDKLDLAIKRLKEIDDRWNHTRDGAGDLQRLTASVITPGDVEKVGIPPLEPSGDRGSVDHNTLDGPAEAATVVQKPRLVITPIRIVIADTSGRKPWPPWCILKKCD